MVTSVIDCAFRAAQSVVSCCEALSAAAVLVQLLKLILEPIVAVHESELHRYFLAQRRLDSRVTEETQPNFGDQMATSTR